MMLDFKICWKLLITHEQADLARNSVVLGEKKMRHILNHKALYTVYCLLVLLRGGVG